MLKKFMITILILVNLICLTNISQALTKEKAREYIKNLYVLNKKQFIELILYQENRDSNIKIFAIECKIRKDESEFFGISKVFIYTPIALYLGYQMGKGVVK